MPLRDSVHPERGHAEATPLRRDAERWYWAVLALSSAVFVALAASVLFWASADRLDVRAVNWVRRTAPDHPRRRDGGRHVHGKRCLPWPVGGSRRPALHPPRPARGGDLRGCSLRGQPASQSGAQGALPARTPGARGSLRPADHLRLPERALVQRGCDVRGTWRSSSHPPPSSDGTAWACSWVAAALILAIGGSRVVLGRHYTLDVLAGIAGGLALVSALLLVLERSRRPGLRVQLFAGNQQPQRPWLDP